MNSKQELAAQKAAIQSQKEAANNSFKKEARMEALRVAERLNPNKSFNLERSKTAIAFDITKEAEKIYQWLIKAIK